jgi:DNA-binding CsgD family transcriptional regulator/Ca2+-binding EF-hand superfamily protein
MAGMIDERTRAALGRLTENERACLARRLQHQTAKERAIDLGISPHAVEKRLKMARTKLGVSSSLEAARLLEASARYGQAGPQAPDLGLDDTARQESADPATPRPAWRRIALYALTGVIAMSLAVIALLSVAPLSAPTGGVAPLPVGGTTPLATAPQAQSSYIVQLLLRQGDKPLGSPKLLVAAGQSARTVATGADGARYDITLSVAEQDGSTYFVKMDLNGSAANGRSIHVTPAALVKAGEPTALTLGPTDAPLSVTLVVTPAGKSDTTPPGMTSIVKTIGEWEAENHIVRPKLVKASPELVKAYVNSAFDGMDRDHSGFIERKEASTTGVAFETTFRKGPPQKLSERPLYADKETEVAVIGGTAGQAAWIGIYDKDGDGKVSRQEYVDHSYEINLARGLPEGWQPPGPPPNMVKAPAETVRLFLNESFDTIDRDHSGFIERVEVPASIGNTPSEISKGPGSLVPHPEAQAAWLAMFDKDADGRVSRGEYMDESFERFANWGVPANWRGAPKVAAK